MSNDIIRILNISIDRDLLSREVRTEVQYRQLFYVNTLPARIVHIVKAPSHTSNDPLEITRELRVLPCAVLHWIWFIPASIWLATKVLREESFDLIQIQEPFVCGLVGVYLANKYRIPLVVGLFSDEIDNPDWLSASLFNCVGNLIGKWVLSRAAAVRTDSKAVAARLSRYKFASVSYVPFLITHADILVQSNPQSAQIRQQLLSDLTGPLLLAVCRLEPEKNISLMLQAFAEVSIRHPEIVLAIAGHGSLAESLRKEADRLAPGRVRWLGWISNSDMPVYYQAADLLLLSSDRESAARVLYECQLAGIPALTTDTAGSCEVIEDGINGRIVPIGDVRAFARALHSLCANPKRLRSMGAEGRRRMVSLVTAESVSRQLRLVYENAMRINR